jgi:hypothetical protein
MWKHWSQWKFGKTLEWRRRLEFRGGLLVFLAILTVVL